MKWINLADRQPDRTENPHTILRRTDTKELPIFGYQIVDNEDGLRVKVISNSAAVYNPAAMYEWLDESEPSLETYTEFLKDRLKDVENPIQHIAPGVWKVGNAYTGDAGAELADKWIREKFKEVPENFKFSAENPQIMTAFELHGKDCRGDLDKFKKFLQDYFPDETRWILAEQHRNTRHDAIDGINNLAHDANNKLFDLIAQEVTNLIQNLKQREP